MLERASARARGNRKRTVRCYEEEGEREEAHTVIVYI